MNCKHVLKGYAAAALEAALEAALGAKFGQLPPLPTFPWGDIHNVASNLLQLLNCANIEQVTELLLEWATLPDANTSGFPPGYFESEQAIRWLKILGALSPFLRGEETSFPDFQYQSVSTEDMDSCSRFKSGDLDCLLLGFDMVLRTLGYDKEDFPDTFKKWIGYWEKELNLHCSKKKRAWYKRRETNRQQWKCNIVSLDSEIYAFSRSAVGSLGLVSNKRKATLQSLRKKNQGRIDAAKLAPLRRHYWSEIDFPALLVTAVVIFIRIHAKPQFAGIRCSVGCCNWDNLQCHDCLDRRLLRAFQVALIFANQLIHDCPMPTRVFYPAILKHRAILREQPELKPTIIPTMEKKRSRLKLLLLDLDCLRSDNLWVPPSEFLATAQLLLALGNLTRVGDGKFTFNVSLFPPYKVSHAMPTPPTPSTPPPSPPEEDNGSLDDASIFTPVSSPRTPRTPRTPALYMDKYPETPEYWKPHKVIYWPFPKPTNPEEGTGNSESSESPPVASAGAIDQCFPSNTDPESQESKSSGPSPVVPDDPSVNPGVIDLCTPSNTDPESPESKSSGPSSVVSDDPSVNPGVIDLCTPSNTDPESPESKSGRPSPVVPDDSSVNPGVIDLCTPSNTDPESQESKSGRPSPVEMLPDDTSWTMRKKRRLHRLLCPSDSDTDASD